MHDSSDIIPDGARAAATVEPEPHVALVADPPPSAAVPEALPSTPEFAAKARDLEALRTAVVDAAGVGAGLWLSYLFVLFYLAIATGGVTHRDLLFENPVKLPFLNVDLPLRGFFVLGPAIFLITHAYVLLHFVMLAGKAGVFHAELEAQIADPEVRTALRRQLPSNIFVQVLAGPRELRSEFTGGLLRFITQVTLVGGPILLLVFFELQFLPFHHEPIAWWQRMAILIDLFLLWKLWPSIARGEQKPIGWRDLGRPKVAAWAVVSLVPILLVFTVATFPGELLNENPLRVPMFRITEPPSETRWLTPHELLVAGEINFVARKPISLWSNRLVLPGVVAVDPAKFDTEAKIAAASETLSLRDRHLEGAVLLGANLRKADFTGAKLREAALGRADLREAHFGCASRREKVYYKQCTELQGASLDLAQLQGASLESAQLQGARLAGARLEGARLDGARLEGALLDGARLQGASLENARLQGASLHSAQLQGASLDCALLQGASLDRARLQGASLDGAQLQGASLYGAQLQGASLDSAQLNGASLNAISVWRTNPRDVDAEGARIVDLDSEPRFRDVSAVSDEWTVDAFASMRALIEELVPRNRGEALKRIEILDPARQPEGEAEWAEAWSNLAKASPPRGI